MSCNSCSNITLPGVAGPAGSPGAAGADGNGIVSVSFQSTTNPLGTPAVAGYTDTYRITYTDATTFDYDIVNGSVGTDGIDGISVLYMDTTGPNTASNNATSSGTNLIRTDQIDGGTIGAVGDFIKIKGEVIADNTGGYFSTVKVKFGGSDMLVWFAGQAIGTALSFEVDLVVSAIDEIRPHVSGSNYNGDRLNQTFYASSYELGGVSATSTSPITLSSNQNIEIELTSDGVNTTTLTYYEVTKYLKS
jgi:negative regulator of sigma E activity